MGDGRAPTAFVVVLLGFDRGFSLDSAAPVGSIDLAQDYGTGTSGSHRRQLCTDCTARAGSRSLDVLWRGFRCDLCHDFAWRVGFITASVNGNVSACIAGLKEF